MNSELITFNEVMNDGSTIHLYFNRFTGFYTAYGFSAYNLHTVAKSRGLNITASFSDAMVMPAVQINKEQLSVLTSQCGETISLQTETSLDRNAYQNWTQALK